MKLVVSDAHEGVKAAAARVLSSAWRRCRVHFQRNAPAHVGKSSRRVVSAFIATADPQPDHAAASAQWRRVADQMRHRLPKPATLMDGAEEDVNVSPDAARLPLPGRDHGLGDTQGAGVARVEHPARRVLHRGAGIEALEEAPARHGPPQIFNTDQGAQFTSPRFADAPLDARVRISMDGKGRWMDNVFIERLWRSLKYECITLRAFETGAEQRAGLRGWIDCCNAHRPRSALGGRTPNEARQGLFGYDAAA